ncbi:MAG: glycosyltransferase family 2 protein [Thermoanaerobaculia bacterium]
MTDLSVVIPTFNTASMTLRCCRAVLASIPDSTEVIVADDGSSDDTAALLAREVPAVHVVRLESNRGFAAAANRGVEVSRGRVIVLLNSDAIVEQGALRALLGALNEGDGVAGAQLLNEDGTLQWSGGRAPTLLWMTAVVSGVGPFLRFFRRRDRVVARREVDWVSGAAMAFRREVWEAAGPLNERFRFYCQDIEFCVRAQDAGWRVRIVPEARVVHRLGGTVAAGHTLQHDPERLWSDLLTWGRARYGRPWSLVARVVLLAAAWLRIVFRSARRDETTAALVRAARRLAQIDS